MADLTAANVTVTIVHKDLTNRRRLNLVTIAFGDGALTIPAGGIPLPALATFGMYSELNLFIDSGVNLYKFGYDKTNHKLFVSYYEYDAAADGVAITAATVAIAATTLYALAYGK